MMKNPRIIAGILILVLSMTLMGVLVVMKGKARGTQTDSTNNSGK